MIAPTGQTWTARSVTATPSAVMHKHLKEELVPPDHLNPSLSAGVGEIIEVAMNKNRKKRYESAEEMLVDLERVLAIRGVGPVDKVTRKIVVITDGARTLGVEVEELLGDEEIVIKSLSEHFSRVKGITGASILGDGRIALILDPVSIIARSR